MSIGPCSSPHSRIRELLRGVTRDFGRLSARAPPATPVRMTALASPTPAYRMSADAVVKAQATDAQLGLGAEEAQARLERYGRNELERRGAGAGLAEVSRAVSRRARHPAAHRDGDFGRAVAVSSANRRCPTKPSRSSPSCCSTRSWATFRNRAPNTRSRRCARCRRRMRTWFATASGRAFRRRSVVPGDIILIEEGDTVPGRCAPDSIRPRCRPLRRR